MRDPRRIKRVLSLLQQIWEFQPDVRFNQLISNLQSLYSQQNDNYGRREVFNNEFIELERTTYLDFFFLEDDKWEKFLNSYLSNIKEGIEQRRDKIDDKAINDLIKLFLDAGIEREQLDEHFKDKLIAFFVRESRWLTVETIVDVVRNFGLEGRKELFGKISKN